MSEVDLTALRRTPATAPRRPRGPKLAAGLLVLVALVVVASFVVPLLRPARAVATARVRAAATTGGAAVRSSLAEAAGWVEPDPFPIVVRPLVAGVLVELPLLEGAAVRKGESVVGRLESAELSAARDRAAVQLALDESALAYATARLRVARSLLEQKAGPREREADARRTLAVSQARLAAGEAALAEARAHVDERAAEHEAQLRLQEAGGSYPVALARADAAWRGARARERAAAAEVERLRADVTGATELLAIAGEVLADPRELAGAVEEGVAEVAKAAATREAARVALAIAERELDWATVRAPANGVVMKLLAAPGDEVGPRGHGLVALYDPARLQARVDVALASAGAVFVGQKVEVRSEVLGDRFVRGEVIRIQHESDLLKNTLQVKVRLVEPDPLLRPETLCRARFLAPERTDGEPETVSLFRVPARAVRNGAVLVVGGDGAARRIAVETVATEGGDAVVRGELSITQRVILDEVEAGTRVKETR